MDAMHDSLEQSQTYQIGNMEDIFFSTIAKSLLQSRRKLKKGQIEVVLAFLAGMVERG